MLDQLNQRLSRLSYRSLRLYEDSNRGVWAEEFTCNIQGESTYLGSYQDAALYVEKLEAEERAVAVMN